MASKLSSLTNTEGVHAKWLQIVQAAQYAVADDMEQQNLTAKGIRIKERSIAPEILGRSYSRYCYLINQMYDAYLNNVHIQRATYIQEIINICMKRLYELRNEMVHLIVNDYVYVDAALVQLQLTPYDIQIIIPYHLPLECRTDSVENFLQKLWAEAPQPATSQIRASWAASTGLDDNVVPPAPKPAPQQDKESEDSASGEKNPLF
ncbi:hypothetical protein SFRURICE_013838 [Spodoptera frugiperda]|nr:hypothetical protein SFRURICE_013838 [Spodoptera frugiperda]